MKQLQYNRIKQQKINKKIRLEAQKISITLEHHFVKHLPYQFNKFVTDHLNKYDQYTKKSYQTISFICENNLVRQNIEYKYLLSSNIKQQYLSQYNDIQNTSKILQQLLQKPKYLKPRIFMWPQSNLINFYLKIRHQIFIKQQKKKELKFTIYKSPIFTNHTTERNTVYNRNEDRSSQKKIKAANFLSNNQSQQISKNIFQTQKSQYFLDPHHNNKQKTFRMKTQKQSQESLKIKMSGDKFSKKKKQKKQLSTKKLLKLQNPYNLINKQITQKGIKKCQSTKIIKQIPPKKLLTQFSTESLTMSDNKHHYTKSEYCQPKKRMKTQKN